MLDLLSACVIEKSFIEGHIEPSYPGHRRVDDLQWVPRSEYACLFNSFVLHALCLESNKDSNIAHEYVRKALA